MVMPGIAPTIAMDRGNSHMRGARRAMYLPRGRCRELPQTRKAGTFVPAFRFNL